MAQDFESLEEYKAHKKEMHERMLSKQRLPYKYKRPMAETRIRDFIEECGRRGLNYHVSVGGLDSIVLAHLIESMGYDVPRVSASSLEDKSIQAVHKEMGCIVVKPIKPKVSILQEEGFPVLSKRIANKIDTLANPTDKNKTVRHAIITGECGAQGHFATDSKMRLPMTYLKLFGGLDKEGEALGYGKPNFKVSHKCCYYLKEKPCDDWAKEHNSVPFLGLMASEGGQRADALEEHGCNYFGKTTARSCPFSFFYHSDVIHLAVDLGVHIPEIYGDVVISKEKNEFGDYEYSTTGEQRTGCSMCGFGIQLESRPHRFDRLFERNPQEWDFWMNRCCKHEDGTPYGWGEVLDYLGIAWRDPKHYWLTSEIEGQKTIFDYFTDDGMFIETE
jgi:3'-phosphoadenosine 5'-phosphosulfate sulfotransferase (PAPS reductase)/FAD synthetase